MRHDIDMDLEAALRLSSLENDLGVYSTYFFMVRCPLYKVFLEKFKYFSDSRGRWAYGHPIESEALPKRENLHILVHPE